MRGLLILLLVLLPCSAFASVLNFIVANNPELQELKAINRNIFRLLTIEVKGGVSYRQTIREDEAIFERARTRYDIGLTASIPLISPSEKAQRRIEEAQKERVIRLEVADLILLYKAEQKAIDEENRILTSLYNELQWIAKRVEAGVDSQKNYNAKLINYLEKRKDLELKKEGVGYLLEKILSYVSEDKRDRLREMLER